MQSTNKDTSSAESENDAETCMISSRKPFSLQKGRKFPKFPSKTDGQQKSVKKKIVHQNHAIVNNDNDSDKTYSPKIKKRRSSKSIFSLSYILFRFYKLIKSEWIFS